MFRKIALTEFIFCLLIIIVLAVFPLIDPSTVQAKSLEEMSLSEIEESIAALTAAIAPLEKEVGDLKSKIAVIYQRINSVIFQVVQLEQNIQKRTEDLVYQKVLFDQKVRRQYLNQRSSTSPLLLFFSTDQPADLSRQLSFSQMVVQKDSDEIITIAENLIQLKKDKERLEKVKKDLAVLKSSFAERQEFLQGEIKSAEDYKAKLSAKQKELLAARAGSFTSAVGEVPISNIACSGPSGSPSYCDPGGGNWFGAFSFGAWTHRKGMSQYGAKGRADAGQNYRQILKAYYGKEPVDKNTGGSIAVTGYGNMDFEGRYLMGIAEMPSSWHKEALKAQAVAARTYAYRYKESGQAICTTQACQVFSQSKADSSPADWRQAVEETRGQVIDGVVTYYSSTSGGYLTTSGWDTIDGQGGEGFAGRAWESKAGSPWFYSGWFTQNYTANSAKCGRSHPWLNEAEMADILNTWLVLKNHRDDSRILPVTINQCPIGGVTGNPYSLEEMKNKANENGGAYTNVSAVSSVRYGNDGATSSLVFQTNKGAVTIPGSELKEAFNLRAPGYIAIRTPLFNIEKK